MNTPLETITLPTEVHIDLSPSQFPACAEATDALCDVILDETATYCQQHDLPFPARLIAQEGLLRRIAFAMNSTAEKLEALRTSAFPDVTVQMHFSDSTANSADDSTQSEEVNHVPHN